VLQWVDQAALPLTADDPWHVDRRE